MYIQVPCNFERVVFFFSGVTEVQELVANYEKNGKSEVPEKARKNVRFLCHCIIAYFPVCNCCIVYFFFFQMAALFTSYSVSHEQIVNIIKKSWFDWKYLIDPHTATGMHFACNENG